MGYWWNRHDEPGSIAEPKPLLIEFGIHRGLESRDFLWLPDFSFHFSFFRRAWACPEEDFHQVGQLSSVSCQLQGHRPLHWSPRWQTPTQITGDPLNWKTGKFLSNHSEKLSILPPFLKWQLRLNNGNVWKEVLLQFFVHNVQTIAYPRYELQFKSYR